MANIEGITHKIITGKRYIVQKTNYRKFTFYKIPVQQPLPDGNVKTYYYPITFPLKTKVEDGDIITINQAIENIRDNPKDKFSFIVYYLITDFKCVGNINTKYSEKRRKEEQQLMRSELISEFNEMVDEDIIITDDDIPF